MQDIDIPTKCPSCNFELIWVKDQLFCKNAECDAQLGKKLEHFTKTLGIKGIGPKTVEKLALNDLTELFYMDKEEVCSVLGSTLGTKILLEIEKAKAASLDVVLAAFSIPLVGATASKKLAAVITNINEITQETCQRAGLGAKVTDNLLNWVNTEYQDMKEFLPFTFDGKIQKVNTDAKRVCITGKLKSYKKKSDAEGALLAAGFILVDSVTKTTDYLVDEEDKGSTKRTKAESLGITIINDLNDLLKEKTHVRYKET